MNENKTLMVSFVKDMGVCIQDKDTFKIYKMETLDEQQINMLYEVLTEQTCKIVNTAYGTLR